MSLTDDNNVVLADEHRELLEQFIYDNHDLTALENSIDHFNIFEALNCSQHEIRHSSYLSFLMNPNESHGLNDKFIRRLLETALYENKGIFTGVSIVDIHTADLSDCEVRTEYKHIDILILIRSLGLAVQIENKLYTSEHSDQLKRYANIVANDFPGINLLSILLCPDDNRPEMDELSYPNTLVITYGMVCGVIESLIMQFGSTLSSEVKLTLQHYSSIVREHFMPNKIITDLCQKIYSKHRRAIDLINKYSFDDRQIIYKQLVSLIENDKQLILDEDSYLSYVRFVPNQLETASLKSGKGWTGTGRILLFEFANQKDALKLSLIIGPGEDSIRQRLFDFATKHNQPSGPFTVKRKALGAQWNTIYQLKILQPIEYEDDKDVYGEKIQNRWDAFIHNQFVEIMKLFETQKWIWDEKL